MAHYSAVPNDENHLSIRFRCQRLFHNLFSSNAKYSPLYSACEKNDLACVQSCLKKMSVTEINVQHQPNNETALHVATRRQHREIVATLLQYGAEQTLRNTDGKQAYELADTEEMKNLFKRVECSRFVWILGAPSKVTCKNCSLVNSNTMYEWEFVDRNASKKAVQFRRAYTPESLVHSQIWKTKLYSLKKTYVRVHEQDLPPKNYKIIHDCFTSAYDELNPNHLIAAYTSCQMFSRLLNLDMARNVIHNLNNGCSQFSCQCLYSTEDGTKSIANIFLHHPNFRERAYQGQVYRGITMAKDKLDHYRVGSCIITTTFLSTSKNPSVARMFGNEEKREEDEHSFFCTYTIISHDRTAIDISQLSMHPHEEEVLILPYSPFLITAIEDEQQRTNIYLQEQRLHTIAEIQ